MPKPLSDSPFLLLGNPSPYLLETLPHLLGNPSFVSWREFPSTLVPSWLYTDPPLLPSFPFPFPPPNGSPYSKACPLTVTLQYWLHKVRYRYDGVAVLPAVPIGKQLV